MVGKQLLVRAEIFAVAATVDTAVAIASADELANALPAWRIPDLPLRLGRTPASFPRLVEGRAPGAPPFHRRVRHIAAGAGIAATRAAAAEAQPLDRHC